MRKAKTLIIGLLTVVLLAGLVLSPGCAKPAEEEKLLIVNIYHYGEEPFFRPFVVGIEDAAEEFGVDFIYRFPSNYDFLETIKIIETELAKGEMDGLIVETGNPDGLVPIIKRVKEELGIPVILTNELYDHEAYDSFCGASGIEVGEVIAKEMELNLLGEGDWAKLVGYEGTGEVEGKIAFMLDAPGQLNVEMRVKGARDYLSQFPGIVDLGVYDQTQDIVKRKETVVNVLTAHPDLAGICNSAEAVGMGQVIEELGLSGQVILCGMDLVPPTLELIKSGVVASTVDQNPYGQGYLPMKAICEYLLYDTPIPKWLPTDLIAITIENVDEYME